jgi:hypothetical protein
MSHYNIVICSPGYDFAAEYVESLSETISECSKKNLSVKWLNGQSARVHHARELSISGDKFDIHRSSQKPFNGEFSYDVIVWIDSDISWNKEDFFKLINSEYDVTTGAYLLTDMTATVYNQKYLGGIPNSYILNMKVPEKIQSCGFGFIAMKKGVFERIPRPWFNLEIAPIGQENGLDIYDMLGEDISWCYKAYKAGIDIWFDPNILVTHQKRVPLRFK